jgi:hypothetical protein
MNLIPQDSHFESAQSKASTLNLLSDLSISDFRNIVNCGRTAKVDSLPSVDMFDSSAGPDKANELQIAEIKRGEKVITGLKNLPEDGAKRNLDGPFISMGLMQQRKVDNDLQQCRPEKLPGERLTDWMRLNHYPRTPLCRDLDQKNNSGDEYKELIGRSTLIERLREKLRGPGQLEDPRLKW